MKLVNSKDERLDILVESGEIKSYEIHVDDSNHYYIVLNFSSGKWILMNKIFSFGLGTEDDKS